MKKLIAATVLSAILFAPGIAHADGAADSAGARADTEGSKDSGPSAARELFASGCFGGRVFIIFSNGNGTYSGGFNSSGACKDEPNWIGYY